MKIVAEGLTDTGRNRTNNEDNFLVYESSSIYVVSDGVGGAAAGEVASKLFVEACMDRFFYPDTDYEGVIKQVEEAFYQADTTIRNYIELKPEHNGMGCTGELLTFFEDNYIIGHVGDSRSYLFRNGNLIQLSKDHSLIQEQIDKGEISEEDAQQHWLKHSIYRAVGHLKPDEVDILKGKLQKGDLFLLCSDGLTDMMDVQSIQSVLEEDQSLENRVKQLIDEANNRGGMDNITALLVAIED